MSHVPFQIAIWALCSALCLTILVGVLADPHRVRLALRDDPQGRASDPVLLAKTEVPDVVETAVIGPQDSAAANLSDPEWRIRNRARHEIPADGSEKHLPVPVAAPLIRVASTALESPLGIESAERPPERSEDRSVPLPFDPDGSVASPWMAVTELTRLVQTVQDGLAAFLAHPADTAPAQAEERFDGPRIATGRPAEMADAALPPQSIPVPRPRMEPEESIDNEEFEGAREGKPVESAQTDVLAAVDAGNLVRQIRQDLTQLQLEQARQELREVRALSEQRQQDWLTGEISHLREQMSTVRMAQRPESPRPGSRSEPVPASVVSDDPDRDSSPGVTVLAGEESGRWTFRFQAVPVPDVLRLLGDYAGWDVVVAPELEQQEGGGFTGTFRNADPQQAFVLVLKAHHFSMTHRGAAVLIGRR